MTELFKPDDWEKRLQRAKESNAKLLKIYGKLDGMSENLNTELGGTVDKLTRSAQGVRTLAAEQHKTIAQFSVEFQQQTAQLTRNFQTAVGEVEGACHKAIDMLMSRAPQPPMFGPPMPQPSVAVAAAVGGRRDGVKRERRRSTRKPGNGYLDDDGDELGYLLKNWHHQEKMSHFDTERITRQFDEMKKKLPDD
jgi:hypothetical protein